MDDDKIIHLVEPGEELVVKKSVSKENHFFMNTFLSYNDAVDYVEEILEKYDQEEYYVGLLEIRHINHAYQAGLSVFKRQGDLFD